MFQNDAYEQMLKINAEKNNERMTIQMNKQGENSSKNLSSNKSNSLRNVSKNISQQEELFKKMENKVFEMIQLKLPAVNNWGMVENKFRENKRNLKKTKRKFLKVEEETIAVSKDFFGNKKNKKYEILFITNLRKIGKQGISFTFGVMCYAFFFANEKKTNRLMIEEDESSILLKLIENKISKMEKKVFHEISNINLKKIEISDKLGEVHFQIPNIHLHFNFVEKKNELMKDGKLVVKGRKKSVDLGSDDDLF
jgi:hypothetical protein